MAASQQLYSQAAGKAGGQRRNKAHNQASPYHWQLTASRRYRQIFITLNLLLLALLLVALTPSLGLVLAPLVLLLSTLVFRRHHALAGESVEMRFNQQQLYLLKRMPDGSVESQALAIESCRWLTAACLVATARATGRRASFGPVRRIPLLLLPDNSSEADRHRLAMYYHCGLLA